MQLYEEVLARYPTTRLRPLTLYRLAWAYRSVNVGGFPRDAEKSIDLLLKESPTSPLSPLASAVKHVSYKTQNAAIAWSIIPGAGQIYAGEKLNGTIRLTIALTFAAAALTPIIFMAQNDELDWRGVLISLTGIIGLQVSYTSAYSDAQRAVLEFNERQEAVFESAHPHAP